jgi:hypothetical protein
MLESNEITSKIGTERVKIGQIMGKQDMRHPSHDVLSDSPDYIVKRYYKYRSPI